MKIIIILFCISLFNLSFSQSLSLSNKLNLNTSSINIDSVKENTSRHYSSSNVFGQLLAGLSCGVAFAILPANRINDYHGDSSTRLRLIISSLIAYSFGSALGVYGVANIENPEISFWGTTGYSLLGETIALLIHAATFNQNSSSNSIGGLLIFALPTLSSMFYAAYSADWPVEANTVKLNNKIFSQKDLVSQSQYFNFEIMRVSF